MESQSKLCKYALKVTCKYTIWTRILQCGMCKRGREETGPKLSDFKSIAQLGLGKAVEWLVVGAPRSPTTGPAYAGDIAGHLWYFARQGPTSHPLPG